MKEFFKTHANKEIKELEREIKEEIGNQAKNVISISLGREKKTHLLAQTRKKIAFLKTLISQRKFIESDPTLKTVGEVAKKSGL